MMVRNEYGGFGSFGGNYSSASPSPVFRASRVSSPLLNNEAYRRRLIGSDPKRIDYNSSSGNQRSRVLLGGSNNSSYTASPLLSSSSLMMHNKSQNNNNAPLVKSRYRYLTRSNSRTSPTSPGHNSSSSAAGSPTKQQQASFFSSPSSNPPWPCALYHQQQARNHHENLTNTGIPAAGIRSASSNALNTHKIHHPHCRSLSRERGDGYALSRNALSRSTPEQQNHHRWPLGFSGVGSSSSSTSPLGLSGFSGLFRPSASTTSIFSNSKIRSGERELQAVRALHFAEEGNAQYRPAMEDGCFLKDCFNGEPSQLLSGVFDGHGGRQTADYCVRGFHDVFMREYIRSPGGGEISNCASSNVSDCLEKSFLLVDDALRNLGHYQIGATATVVFVRKEAIPCRKDTNAFETTKVSRVIYCANVGDSRAILVGHNGIALRLSYDDKAFDRSEIQRVVKAGGAILRHRLGGQLAVTRALGDHSLKNAGLTAFPHVNRKEIDERKDRCIIIATDGLWDVIADQEAANIASSVLDRIGGNFSVAKELVACALAKGTRDNVLVQALIL